MARRPETVKRYRFCGSAAVMCGKPLAYRQLASQIIRGGSASAGILLESRDGKASLSAQRGGKAGEIPGVY